MNSIFGMAAAGSMFVMVGGLMFLMVVAIVLVARFCRQVEQGRALVRTGIGGPRVSFGALMVFPVIHKCVEMDLTLKRVDVSFRDGRALRTSDVVPLEIQVAFLIRVERNAEAVLRVAEGVGAEESANPEMLRAMFHDRFAQAVADEVRATPFDALDRDRLKFKERVIARIGSELHGFVLDTVAIDHLGKPAGFE